MAATRRRVHNPRIILPRTQDSDPLHHVSKTSLSGQKTYKNQRFSKKASFFIAELTPALLLLIIPFSVHAGFFSKIAGLFTEEAAAEIVLDQVNYSAQSTPLLSATKNPDPLKAVGGGDIFTDNGVLVSTGPIGEDEINASKVGGGEISVYVVREGDSLSQIAEMYGVTSNTILWANDISKSTDIHPGDTLIILPIVGVRHTVAKGETLSSIVKKYEADLEEVLQYNELSSVNALVVGDELLIPGGELHTARTVASSPTPTKTSGVKASGAGLSHPAPGAYRSQGIHGYNGVDLASKSQLPILAAASGSVIVAKGSGWNGGYGNYIVIKHGNGTQTLYAHLSSVHVVAGATVSQGQQIGVMGNTGKSTGTHLHFEVRGGTNPF
jgi:LysM repeat protein